MFVFSDAAVPISEKYDLDTAAETNVKAGIQSHMHGLSRTTTWVGESAVPQLAINLADSEWVIIQLNVLHK